MADQLDVQDVKGEKAGSVELPASLFDVQTNVPLLHQVVTAQLAAARQGTHKTKNRGEVSGSGRKPFKQKGTGRSRQGSIRAPEHTGGGIVHGPVPRSYAQRTPKKMIAAALQGALSDRARGGRIHVVESLVAADAPKTKDALACIERVSAGKNVLVVLDRGEETSFLSVRNLPQVHVLAWDQLNAYDVLVSDDILFSKLAYVSFVASRNGSAVALEGDDDQVEAVATVADVDAAEKADEAEVADGGFEGSAAPLEDGSAPEGFVIKGNKDSMKYHRPEGQWYDATVAEVWFRTAEDAEAAGFVEAGTKANADKDEN